MNFKILVWLFLRQLHVHTSAHVSMAWRSSPVKDCEQRRQLKGKTGGSQNPRLWTSVTLQTCSHPAQDKSKLSLAEGNRKLALQIASTHKKTLKKHLISWVEADHMKWGSQIEAKTEFVVVFFKWIVLLITIPQICHESTIESFLFVRLP